ncbi:MAG: OmpA family protein [Bacteroidia bacterium]|nr:OmpA family protein [Bacteroidia bacterium]
MRFVLFFFSLFIYKYSSAQFVVKPLSTRNHVQELVNNYFLGDGIKITKVSYKGKIEAIGAFTDYNNCVGIPKGMALSTGSVSAIAGPNYRNNTGANFGDYFFFDESLITKASQCDGVVLEIEFIPLYDSLSFKFQFGSEEYPEFVGKEFNDMFLIELKPMFIKAKPKNLAILPDKKMISINNVNAKKNNELYIDNTNPNNTLYQTIEWDGLTKPMYVGTRVHAGKPYHLKILLTDIEDCEYDSGVLLEAYSFRSFSSKAKKTLPIKKSYAFQFENNKATFIKSQENKLKQLADSLYRFSFDSIVAIGHTDNNGTDSANQILSELRAQAVIEYFKNTKIKCVNYTALGKGSTVPLVPNISESNKAINRRVELIFYPKIK